MFYNKKIISDECEKLGEIRLARSKENLRDWFAGQVISELCREQWAGSQFSPEGIADRAYEIAEAMMNKRANAKKQCEEQK